MDALNGSSIKIAPRSKMAPRTDGRTDGRTTDGRRTDDGRKKFRRKNSDKKIPTKKFRRKNSDEKIRTKKFGRKKIGGKARGQGTAAAEARHG